MKTTTKPGNSTRLKTKEVAERLFLDGERPTLNNVREALGGGGSAAINEAIKEWFCELSIRYQKLNSRPDIPQEVFDIASTLWDAALEKAAEAKKGKRSGKSRAKKPDQDLAAQVVELRAMIEELQRNQSS